MPLNPNSFKKQLIRPLIWWFCMPASPQSILCWISLGKHRGAGVVYHGIPLKSSFSSPLVVQFGWPLAGPLAVGDISKVLWQDRHLENAETLNFPDLHMPLAGAGYARTVEEQETGKIWIKLTTFPQLIVSPGWIESPMLITHMLHIYQHLPNKNHPVL